MSSKSKTANALTVLSLMVLAGSAMAQGPAMGDGRALEANLQVGGQGNVPRPNFMNEVRARNALVTGNAPSGKSLRINPGYTDPDDFRGQLGTDDLFRFRRDSIQSAPGFRGTQGLQYQSAFTIGNTVSAAAAPRVITRLDAYGAGNELPRSGYTPRPELPAERLRLQNPYAATRDELSASMRPQELSDTTTVLTPVGTLRSTGAFTSTMGLAPAMVGTQATEDGKGPLRNVTASSLLGLRVDRQAQELSDRDARGMTSREIADWQPRRAENTATGPDMSPGGPDQSAATPAFRTSYDDLKMRLDEQARAKTPTMETKTAARPGEQERQENIPEWQRRVNALREQMEQERRDQERTAPKAAPPEETTPKPEQPEKKEDSTKLKPGSKTPEQLRKERDEARLKKTKDEQDKRRRALGGMDDETLNLIKKAGGEAHSYTAGTPGSLFDVHVRAGEDALKKGQYFDAEERFARALSMRPGDVTVMAARLNSQIGAGLYLSAAVNLRQLLEQHPEMIGVRYTGATMPPQARLETLIQEFRKAIDKAKSDKLPVPEESALLLAYIGFQAKDQAAVRDGLDTLVAAPSGSSDTLLPVLRRVWLEDAVDLMK